jgi:hypothetical protein
MVYSTCTFCNKLSTNCHIYAVTRPPPPTLLYLPFQISSPDAHPESDNDNLSLFLRQLTYTFVSFSCQKESKKHLDSRGGQTETSET